jgi:hypothetical protein
MLMHDAHDEGCMMCMMHDGRMHDGVAHDGYDGKDLRRCITDV